MSLPTLSQSPQAPDFVQDPYPFYEQARALGPLFVWSDYGMPCAISHDLVHELLRDRRFGREPPEGMQPTPPEHLKPFYDIERHSMLEREPPTHTRLRGLVLRAFTSRRIAELAPEITALSHDLIDAFPDAKVDLLPAFAEKLPVIVIARLLGVPDAMAGQLLVWSHAMVAMYQARRDRAVEDAAVAASVAFADFLRDHIAARRNTAADDLLSHLIAANADGERLSDDEMISTAILLLNAGHEATVHTIGNGVNAMLGAGLRTVTNVDALVDEVLRHDPPLHMFTRYAREEVTVAGHRFRPGDQVGLLLAAANRDPARIKNPARFDPMRDATGHTSFGGGLHFCVGAPLARLELKIVLPILFERCPNLRRASTPRYADRYHFHGLENLWVRI